MIHILIVEDGGEKVKRIASALGDVDGVDLSGIRICGDVVSAKRFLSEESFDLLIVDIAIPIRADKDPAPDGGLQLVDAIYEGAPLRMPTHIVGLTAYEESYEAVRVKFDSKMLFLVHYDQASDNWTEHLQARIRQIISASRQPSESFGCNLVILCALQSEFEAVRRLPWSWKQAELPADHAIYWEGEYVGRSGQQRVYAGVAPRMGMPAAAVSATKMIATFRPRYFVMTGIAAGVRGKVNLGDVLVADPTWDWGNGKRAIRNKKPAFLQAPHQIGLDARLRTLFSTVREDFATLAAIRASWQGTSPPTSLALHIGPVASGSAVLADGATAASIVAQHREVIGIDMETYAVFAAASEASRPQPTPFVLKSVVDFAEPDKADNFQKYGAYVSAQVLQHFVEKLL